ncbi:MAG: type II secretion system GspH family protein [Syntrophales bacterium]|nr:type II secretion system GspH family protein [Syntrophales bacterium]
MRTLARSSRRNGFSLIELIVIIVLFGIMGTFLITLKGPLVNSTASYSWFQDQMALQQEMENIIGQYKYNRSTQGTLFGLTAFRSWVLGRPYVVSAETGFITFTPALSAGTTTYSSSSIQTSPPGGVPAILIVTLRLNGQTLSCLLS